MNNLFLKREQMVESTSEVHEVLISHARDILTSIVIDVQNTDE